MRYVVLFIVTFSSAQFVVAQRTTNDAATQEYIEEVISSIEGDNSDNLEYVLLLLEQLTRRPLNLNHDDLSPLVDANLISDIQLQSLMDHRERYGKFLAIYELQTLPNWSMEDIRRIVPIIRVDRNLDDLSLGWKEALKQSSIEAQAFYSTRFPEAVEFKMANDTTSPKFEGSPFRHYVRLRAQYQYRLSVGLTAEKDNGESYFSKSNSNYDYLSFHAYGQSINKYIRVLALGDYKVNLGQGLILHNGFGGSKSAFVSQIKKGGRIFRPHASTSEVNFFRGGGIELNLGRHYHIAAFYSSVKRDANIRTDTLDDDSEITAFTSLQTSGLHRTVGEIEDEKKIRYDAMGGRIGYERSKLQVHVNALYNRFDREFARPVQPYSQFRFRGSNLFNASIDYSISLGQWHIFGESATSEGDALAHLVGVKTGLNKKVSWIAAYRHYPRDYVSIQPSAFGESREANNESGFYNAIEYAISQKFQLYGYVDFWTNPWLRFNVDGLTNGQEYLFKFRYYKKRKLEAYAQFRHESKAVGYNDDTPFSSFDRRRRNQLRCHFIYKLNKSLEWRSRIEFNHVDFRDETSSGYLVYQDFIFKALGFPLSFTTRYAFFNTDNSLSRIYAYENHLLNNYRLPSFAGTGHRYYLNLRYRPVKSLTLEARYELTSFTDPDIQSITNGSQTFKGNNVHGVAFQVRVVL